MALDEIATALARDRQHTSSYRGPRRRTEAHRSTLKRTPRGHGLRRRKKGAGARGFGYWGEAPAVVTGMYLSNARSGMKVTAEEFFFELFFTRTFLRTEQNSGSARRHREGQ